MKNIPSADRHPDIFTGNCATFRSNIIRVISDTGVSIGELSDVAGIDAMTFSKWLNCSRYNGVQPTVDEISKLIEYVESLGCDWI